MNMVSCLLIQPCKQQGLKKFPLTQQTFFWLCSLVQAVASPEYLLNSPSKSNIPFQN